MDRKRQWYLNNKELVASRERERKEKMKETNEYKERMFVRKLASYHNKTLKILLKPRNKNFDKKEYLAKYRKTYDNKKYRDDEQFRLRKVMRARLHSAFKAQNITKKNRTMEYIGCSTEELKAHIERQFTEGMSWENYPEWHIDHIFPISKVDLTIEENIYKVMHYSNLQPLWAKENQKKYNKFLG